MATWLQSITERNVVPSSGSDGQVGYSVVTTGGPFDQMSVALIAGHVTFTAWESLLNVEPQSGQVGGRLLHYAVAAGTHTEADSDDATGFPEAGDPWTGLAPGNYTLVAGETDDWATYDGVQKQFTISGASSPPDGTTTITDWEPGVGYVDLTIGYTESDQTGFEIRYGEAGDWTSIGNVTSYRATGVDDDTATVVEIRAVNGDGAGTATAPLSIYSWPVFTGLDDFSFGAYLSGHLPPWYQDTNNLVVVEGLLRSSTIGQGFAVLRSEPAESLSTIVDNSSIASYHGTLFRAQVSNGELQSGYAVGFLPTDNGGGNAEIYKYESGTPTLLTDAVELSLETAGPVRVVCRTDGLDVVFDFYQFDSEWTLVDSYTDSTDPILLAGRRGAFTSVNTEGLASIEFEDYSPGGTPEIAEVFYYRFGPEETVPPGGSDGEIVLTPPYNLSGEENVGVHVSCLHEHSYLSDKGAKLEAVSPPDELNFPYGTLVPTIGLWWGEFEESTFVDEMAVVDRVPPQTWYDEGSAWFTDEYTFVSVEQDEGEHGNFFLSDIDVSTPRSLFYASDATITTAPGPSGTLQPAAVHLFGYFVSDAPHRTMQETGLRYIASSLDHWRVDGSEGIPDRTIAEPLAPIENPRVTVRALPGDLVVLEHMLVQTVDKTIADVAAFGGTLVTQHIHDANEYAWTMLFDGCHVIRTLVSSRAEGEPDENGYVYVTLGVDVDHDEWEKASHRWYAAAYSNVAIDPPVISDILSYPNAIFPVHDGGPTTEARINEGEPVTIGESGGIGGLTANTIYDDPGLELRQNGGGWSEPVPFSTREAVGAITVRMETEE